MLFSIVATPIYFPIPDGLGAGYWHSQVSTATVTIIGVAIVAPPALVLVSETSQLDT